jgi:hypothetical protein
MGSGHSGWSGGQVEQVSPQARPVQGAKVSQVPQQTVSISEPTQGWQSS